MQPYSFTEDVYPTTAEIVDKLNSLGLDAVLYSEERTGNVVTGFGFTTGKFTA